LWSSPVICYVLDVCLPNCFISRFLPLVSSGLPYPHSLPTGAAIFFFGTCPMGRSKRNSSAFAFAGPSSPACLPVGFRLLFLRSPFLPYQLSSRHVFTTALRGRSSPPKSTKISLCPNATVNASPLAPFFLVIFRW